MIERISHPKGVFAAKGHSHVAKRGNIAAQVEPHRRAGRDRYFAAHPPATTLLVVTSLADPDFLLEIDAVALTD